jgi:DNA segregation ATPase FtsK/SpoIIIE-like protein
MNNTTRQNKNTCPQCGISVDSSLGMCPNCGLLFGNSYTSSEPAPHPRIAKSSKPSSSSKPASGGGASPVKPTEPKPVKPEVGKTEKKSAASPFFGVSSVGPSKAKSGDKKPLPPNPFSEFPRAKKAKPPVEDKAEPEAAAKEGPATAAEPPAVEKQEPVQEIRKEPVKAVEQPVKAKDEPVTEVKKAPPPAPPAASNLPYSRSSVVSPARSRDGRPLPPNPFSEFPRPKKAKPPVEDKAEPEAATKEEPPKAVELPVKVKDEPVTEVKKEPPPAPPAAASLPYSRSSVVGPARSRDGRPLPPNPFSEFPRPKKVKPPVEDKAEPVAEVKEEPPKAVEPPVEEKVEPVAEIKEEPPKAVESPVEEKVEPVAEVKEEPPKAAEASVEEKVEPIEEIKEEPLKVVEPPVEEKKESVAEVKEELPKAAEPPVDEKKERRFDDSELRKAIEGIIEGLMGGPVEDIDEPVEEVKEEPSQPAEPLVEEKVEPAAEVKEEPPGVEESPAIEEKNEPVIEIKEELLQAAESPIEELLEEPVAETPEPAAKEKTETVTEKVERSLSIIPPGMQRIPVPAKKIPVPKVRQRVEQSLDTLSTDEKMPVPLKRIQVPEVKKRVPQSLGTSPVRNKMPIPAKKVQVPKVKQYEEQSLDTLSDEETLPVPLVKIKVPMVPDLGTRAVSKIPSTEKNEVDAEVDNDGEVLYMPPQKSGASVPALSDTWQYQSARPPAEWQLPPVTVLDKPPEIEMNQTEVDKRARLIEEAIASYGVEAKVVEINVGPTVTQFGVEPGWDRKFKKIKERDASGNVLIRLEEVSKTRVKVDRISALANDLALALAAPSIRIEAPVPGKPMVGIEVPNTTFGLVSLRSVIESAAFQKASAKSKLGLALGKGAGGETVVGELDKMPHLLIAGATGSGKSACLNSIICSLISYNSPDDVRLIMIDPKRVELTNYNSLPHLISPVVVDTEKAVLALRWLNEEMDNRYSKFARAKARNIEGYNKIRRYGETIPYIVLIIDELADLMMAASDEVEHTLCRLAQLARATGIHLVVATQRPSVDVITGLIKANFPTRISFALTSQVDSRTILDSAGAEKLLGRGDMLFMPPDASKPKRLQGTFASDAEIDRIVNYWSTQKRPQVEQVRFEDMIQPEPTEKSGDDALLEAARQVAIEHKNISTSYLQRRLRIGYPRAARIMEMLEEEGYGRGAVESNGQE